MPGGNPLILQFQFEDMKEIINVDTITQVHDFFNYPKPKHPLVSVIRHTEDFHTFDFNDKRFVFNLYNISLKQFKRGSFNYGRNTYDFEEGTIVFMKPGQVVEFTDDKEMADDSAPGWSLMFHPDLLRKSELGRSILDYSFFDYDSNEALHLSDAERNSLTELIHKIENEYDQIIDMHSQDLIVSNIDLLLKYCKRFYDRQFYTRTNINKDLLSRFEEIIRDYYRNEMQETHGVLSVSYCSDKMNLSANYLGDLIKSEIGKSAKEVLQDHLIDKAKNKLIGSSESISEIAYSLGYEQAQSFNRMFKSKTGMSPGEYRKLN